MSNEELENFYPIPYFKDLFITAPRGSVFRFELLDVIPVEAFNLLSPELQLKNVIDITKQIEKRLNIRIDFNMVESVRIQVDFEIPDPLVDVFKKSTEEGVLHYNSEMTTEQSKATLEEFARTKCNHRYTLLGIMKIWKGNTLIGYATPHAVLQEERHAFKIPLDDRNDWHRLGSIFVLPEHRGNRVTTEVIDQFYDSYKHLVWQCDANNHASALASESAGFKYSHTIYFNDEATLWSFDKDFEFAHGYKVFKIDGQRYQ